MNRFSPISLRSGSKGKVQPTADKKNRERSLSTSSAPEISMAFNSDKQSKVIEDYVNKHLSRDDVFTNLVDRISLALKSVIETAVQTAVAAANERILELSREVAGLRQRVQQFDVDLADKCDELEQYQRRDNLRVFGVPETRGEVTDNLVLQLFKEKLGVELPAESLSRSHRVGRQQQASDDGSKRHRPLIVKFASYRYRRMVFSAKKNLKGSGITIREDLTAARQRLYQKAVAVHGVRNTWTNDGRILWVDKDGGKGVATTLADLGPDK